MIRVDTIKVPALRKFYNSRARASVINKKSFKAATSQQLLTPGRRLKMKIALVVVLLCLAMVNTGIARSFPSSMLYRARATGTAVHKVLSQAKGVAPSAKIDQASQCSDAELGLLISIFLDNDCIEDLAVIIDPNSSDAQKKIALRRFCSRKCDAPFVEILKACGLSEAADDVKKACASK